MTARHGARAALALGLVASLAGNVIAAHPTALGRLVAAWPPLALLVAIELVTRIPTRGGTLSAVRLSSAGLLVVIAAWVSYWHLVELARAAGEGGIAAHILPLSVDGLVAVASVCLRELSPTPNHRAPGRPARATATATPPVRRSPSTSPAPVAVRRGSGEEVRRLAAEHPDWTRDQLAAAAGCSARTVRRHLAAAPSSAAERSLDDELADLVTPTPAPAVSPVPAFQETL
ncbi:MAG: DUF2637 domain-containing protein [Acidimicrobiales bacterium]